MQAKLFGQTKRIFKLKHQRTRFPLRKGCKEKTKTYLIAFSLMNIREP